MMIPPQFILLAYSTLTFTVFAVTSGLHAFDCP